MFSIVLSNIIADPVETLTLSRLKVEDIDNSPFDFSFVGRNIAGGLISYTYGSKKEHKVSLTNLSEDEKNTIKGYSNTQQELVFKIYDDYDDSEIESYTCIIVCESFKGSQRDGVYSCSMAVKEI